MTLTPISDLKFFPGNARKGDIDTIAESLDLLGQFRPIVVNRGTHAPELRDTILAGNHTVKAATTLGWDMIDVHWVDVDEDTAKRIVLVDNRASDKADYDVLALVNLATELPNLDATGFTRDELDHMLDSLDVNLSDLLPEPNGPDPDSLNILVECDTIAQRDTLKARLLADGFNAGIA